EPRRGNPGSCSADCKGRGGTVEFHRSSLVLHAGGALLEAPFDDQQPAAIVREYTAAQKSETSVPATGMSASISISAPSSVNQHASTLYSSIVSRWESTAPRIRSALAARTTGCCRCRSRAAGCCSRYRRQYSGFRDRHFCGVSRPTGGYSGSAAIFWR